MIYDLIIVGGGPAGTAAGVYAARKKLKTLLIAEEIGGQSIVSSDIQNWIGTPIISGHDLAESFKAHLEAYKDDALALEIGARATHLSKNGEHFIVETSKEKFEARSVLITSGAHRKKLLIPGAAEYENKGVVYCASCDGPLFSGMDLVVIGGGNAGFESAAQLLAYAKSVTLLHHSAEFKAEQITIQKVLAHPNMKAIKNAEPLEIKGEQMVSSIVYKDKISGETHELPTKGVFVEVGLVPNTDFVKELLPLDIVGRIKTDPNNQRTEVEGVWAAGDVTTGLYHQNNIAAGDAVKALEDIYQYL